MPSSVDASSASESDEEYLPPSKNNHSAKKTAKDRNGNQSDSDSLPSVGNDSENENIPDTQNQRRRVIEMESSSDEENVDRPESLPSVGSASDVNDGQNSNLNRLALDFGVSDQEFNDDDRSNDGSLPSVNGNGTVAENGANTDSGLRNSVTQGSVSGFRVRVGPDGEETFEFASENEESSSEEEDDGYNPGWFDQIGVQPAAEFNIGPAVLNRVAARMLHGQRRASAAAQRRLQVTASQRPPRARSGPSASSETGTPAETTRRRRKPAATKKRRKRKSPKKKPPKKKRAPPKPLAPLTIHEDWNGNEDCKPYLKLISKTTQHRIHINIQEKIKKEAIDGGEKNQKRVGIKGEASPVVEEVQSMDCNTVELNGSEEPQSRSSHKSEDATFGYKVAQVQFDRCSTHEWKWENKQALHQSFPHFIDLTLHVSNQPSSSILHMKIKKTLRGEETSQRVGSPLKLSKRDSMRELVFVGTEHYFFHVDPVNLPVDLFSNRALGNRKTFIFDFNKFDMENQSFHFDIILLDSAVMGGHDIHGVPIQKSPLMQEVFTNFFGVPHPPHPLENEAREKEDIQWFYGQIKKYHKQEQLPSSDIPLQPDSLKPTLRQYQRDAVQWMLYREGCLKHCEAHSSKAFQNRVDLISAFLDKMYFPIELTTAQFNLSEEEKAAIPEKKLAYYNLHTAYLCWEKPTVPSLPSGGILCDEMGLGKTVETLCLILLNQKAIPAELEEYYGCSRNENQVDDEMNGEDASNSEDEISSNGDDDSESNYSDSSVDQRKRKKGKRKTSRKSTSVTPKVNRPLFKSTKRRRASSPCEFTAAADDDEIASSGPATVPSTRRRSSSRKKNMTAFTFVENKIKSIKRKRRAAKENKGESQDKGSTKRKPPALFEAMKVLYDSALSEYRFADFARSTPKFHGKFYDVELELREFFECICGESDEGCEDWEIVKCSVCSSSQHAECVGFDENIASLFIKLGRKYLCPHCEALNPPFETKSTLIITPSSISHQWISEIQKHVRNHRLNILLYKGVSKHGYLPPAKLARYDIVITTYNVLSSELDYVDLPHCNSSDGRRFRNPKRFLTKPSPLPSVLWWRVCLDEAQMVEGINTKMSLMAMKFKAVHRWCVTGTPMNKGLQDLFGLFVFLQVYPVSYDIWWDALIRDAFFRKETSLLYELFGQLIWRNGKQDVLDQLGIPPQADIVHWLKFSPLEKHFYKQQQETCFKRILEKINRLERVFPNSDILNARLTSLDRFSLTGLLNPFLELRQACCHPQVVRGHIISLQKKTLTMEELLNIMIKKAQLECIEDHRKMIGALNAMAGLFIIKEDYAAAAEKYREVLQSAEKNKEYFLTDSLQLLHAKENLAEILDAHHDGIPYRLADDSLRSDADALRTKYMKKYSDAVKAAQDAVIPLSNSVEEVRSQFTMHRESWWIAALKAAKRNNKVDGLVQTLKQDLLDVTKKNVQKTVGLASKFYDGYGLEHTLIPILMEMDQLRDSVLAGLEELQNNDISSFVENAIHCHLRQESDSYYNDKQRGDKCQLCMYHDNFLLYESVIFKIESKDKISRTGRNWQHQKLLDELADDPELAEKTKEELHELEAQDLLKTTEHVQLYNTELRRGNWGDSETEVLLKGILRFAKSCKLNPDIAENGQVHMKLFEVLKKEFRFLRILWRQIYDQVSALDELSQATTRMVAVADKPGKSNSNKDKPTSSRNMKQLKSTNAEKAVKIQNIYIIAHHEVDTKMTEMIAEYATGEASLAPHLGQLIYLNTLKKNGYGKKGTFNTDDCPICSIQLGQQWCVLRCGHGYCSECVKKMFPNTHHSFPCPLCRHSMKFGDVTYVDTTERLPGKIEDEPAKVSREINGSHSAKVGAVVETLLSIQETHPGEKCIVFSTWPFVLEIISRALYQNDIKYILLNLGKKFHENLEKFKHNEDVQVLLMPLSSGAKGLNIIEATHVFLVEPILNLASELQAIGRVHRIGQTKPTFVHRFYVKETIEEKLFQILKGQDISADEEGSLTVNDLKSMVLVEKNDGSSSSPSTSHEIEIDTSLVS